jgi:hypothetical protein
LSTGVKVGIGVALLAGLVVWGTRTAKKAITDFTEKLTFDIIGFLKPTLRNFVLTVPVQIKFNNPSSLAINLDNITVDLYVLKNNTYVKAVRVSQALLIPIGISVKEVYPEINLKSIFGGDITDTIYAFANALTMKFITVKAEVNITYNGVNLPTQYIQPQQLAFS